MLSPLVMFLQGNIKFYNLELCMIKINIAEKFFRHESSKSLNPACRRIRLEGCYRVS